MILDEMERAIAKITNGDADTSRQRWEMERAFKDASVSGYEVLIPIIQLPDDGDHHVLAAAVHTRAQVLVTDNLKDFPVNELVKFGIEPKSPDDFIADTITLHEQTAFKALKVMREGFQNPELSTEVIIQTAKRQGLLKTALLMKEYERYW